MASYWTPIFVLILCGAEWPCESSLFALKVHQLLALRQAFSSRLGQRFVFLPPLVPIFPPINMNLGTNVGLGLGTQGFGGFGTTGTTGVGTGRPGTTGATTTLRPNLQQPILPGGQAVGGAGLLAQLGLGGFPAQGFPVGNNPQIVFPG